MDGRRPGEREAGNLRPLGAPLPAPSTVCVLESPALGAAILSRSCAREQAMK